MEEPRRRSKTWRIVALVAIAILIVIGWTQRHRFVPLEAGSPVPSYSGRKLDGETFHLDSLRGKVVLLNVWATWCRPCTQEMPALEALYRELNSEGLEVVAVSTDAPAGGVDAFGQPGGDVEQFVHDYGLTFTIVHDPDKRVERDMQVIGLPTTLVIDREGRIVRKVLGAEAWDDAEHIAEMRKLLKKGR